MKCVKHPMRSFYTRILSGCDLKPNESEFLEGKVWTCVFLKNSMDGLMPQYCHSSKHFSLPWHFIPFQKNQGKPICSVLIEFEHFKFLVPEDWIFLSWLEAGQFMSELDLIVLIYGTIMETWSSGMNVWPLVMAMDFGEWHFPRVCWNLESETKIYSSSCSASIPSKVPLGKKLFFEFQFQHFFIRMWPSSEQLWELNERKYRMHTAWYIGGRQSVSFLLHLLSSFCSLSSLLMQCLVVACLSN